MIDLPKISLSANAAKAFHVIYKKYLSDRSEHYSNTSYLKAFSINSLFPNSNSSDIMSSLIELSKKKLIRLFTDKRFMIHDEAFIYLENRFDNGFIKKDDF